MKKTVVVALSVAALTLIASAAPAAANRLVSVGVTQQAGKATTYVYGEVDLTPALAGSLEFESNRLALGLWYGDEQGFYGQFESRTGDGNGQFVEVGGWRVLPVSERAELIGWIGAQTGLGGSNVWVKASAEVAVGLTESIAAVVGGDTTLLKEDHATSTWLGLAYLF